MNNSFNTQIHFGGLKIHHDNIHSCVFLSLSIYVAMLTLRWIKKSGGINKIEKRNQLKATKIYDEIDRNALFSGFTNKIDRSIMNATFNLNNESFKTEFETMCIDSGINGINGHRSIGGYRASMYNALNIESVDILIQIMKQIEKKA